MKSTGLLSNSDRTKKHFIKHYPTVEVFDEVTSSLLQKEVIILMDFYQIDHEFYSLFDTWNIFFKHSYPNFQKYKNTALAVAGIKDIESTNYLSLINPPPSIVGFVNHCIPIKASRLTLPKSDYDILDPLNKMLLSHGYTLPKRLGNFQSHINALNLSKDGQAALFHQQARLILDFLVNQWPETQSFLKFMPNYPAFAQVATLQSMLLSVIEEKKLEQTYLTQLSGQVISIQNSINDMVQLFDLDKGSE